jgi:hypothetical protein
VVAASAAPDGGRNNPPPVHKKRLSPVRQRLLELMQDINFGRIDSLKLSSGEPVLTPRPVVIREHKFGGENGPRPELGKTDFLLKEQAIQLFAFFDQLQNGVIETLEIKHGLPFRVIVREVPA